MYHIKHDKRAQNSVQLICDGLLRCLEEKPYEQVSISDVQRASTVSRSTFYRNFDCLDDVLALMCDRGFEEAFQQLDKAELREVVFKYWFRHSDFLEVLVKSHRTDMIFDSFRRSAADLKQFKPLLKDPDTYDYFISMLSSSISGILVTWVEHGRRESEKELMQKIKKCFRAMIVLGIVK